MSGLDHIVDMINEKTTEKEDKIIKEAERHKKIKLEEAQRRAKDVADAITKKAELQAKSELSKYEASAKLKSKYKILEAKETLIADTLSAAEEDLEKIVGKAEYKKILARLVLDGGLALAEDSLELILPENHSSHIDIALLEKDISKAIGKKVKLTISKETLRSKGGVIIRTMDGSRWVDNTFENRLERFENKIRDTIASILFEQEDKK
ncbi:MAG: hypothetical protein JW779_00185 [Candidatus Thorarchaeota archaeon]|nr:hypothetical protein [Candidatus Thorarchaeota archaeon]